MTSALGRFTATAEAYPDLKANQNMMQLSEELTSTENKVAFSRQAYNDSVMSYNNRRQAFPARSSPAASTSARPRSGRSRPDHPETREAPKVQF